MSNAPKEIWLQWDPDGDAEMYDYPSEGVTWCGEQIHDTDVRYVRADAQNTAPEPDWATAPEDAVAWAVDADGEAHWFVDTPVIYGIRWLSTRHEEMEDDGRYVIPWGIDWRTTLRRRPNA